VPHQRVSFDLQAVLRGEAEDAVGAVEVEDASGRLRRVPLHLVFGRDEVQLGRSCPCVGRIGQVRGTDGGADQTAHLLGGGPERRNCIGAGRASGTAGGGAASTRAGTSFPAAADTAAGVPSAASHPASAGGGSCAAAVTAGARISGLTAGVAAAPAGVARTAPAAAAVAARSRAARVAAGAPATGRTATESARSQQDQRRKIASDRVHQCREAPWWTSRQ